MYLKPWMATAAHSQLHTPKNSVHTRWGAGGGWGWDLRIFTDEPFIFIFFIYFCYFLVLVFLRQAFSATVLPVLELTL